MAGIFGAKDTIELIMTLPVEQSIILIADPGQGKSEVVKQAARMMNIPCIDFRLSQNDVGDIKGLPFHVRGRTIYAPPEFFPLSEGDEVELGELLGIDNVAKNKYGEKGILFLDEINRAEKDVENSAFELVLDRRLNLRSLPPGWRVVAAINGDSDVCSNIRTMDVAFASRFFSIEFRPTHQEFLKYQTKKNMHPAVLSLLKQRNDLIDPSKELLKKASMEEFMKVHDRRAWEKLSNALHKYEQDHREGKITRDIFNVSSNSSYDFLKQIARGWVGRYAGDEFATYVKTSYRVYDGNILLNKWSPVTAEHIKELVNEGSLSELSHYGEMIIEWIDGNIKIRLSDTQEKNLREYITLLPNELRADFWQKFDLGCKNVAHDWVDRNPINSDLILSALA